jgi:uncharacterized protein (TIGR02391 family)
MPVIADIFATVDDFINAPAEDRGVELLLFLQQRYGAKHFAPSNLRGEITAGWGTRGAPLAFSHALSEAIEWMRNNLLAVPDLDQASGAWMVLTPTGQMFTRKSLDLVRLRRALPEYLLHPRIRDVSLQIFMIGKFEASVFEAFKEIEIVIRDTCGYNAEQHGAPMVVKAFHNETGPLRLDSEVSSERQAMQNFMSGAIGLFKNPRSHRNTDLDDPIEAAELLIIASHIMRIVEAKTPTTA